MPRRRRDYEVESIVEQFRDLRSDYDAAKQTRFKRKRTGVSSVGSHADYHYRTWTAYAHVMETARDLFRNHCLIGQGIRRLVANILRGGFTLDVKTGDDVLNDELSARWYEWAESPDLCDHQGEQDFYGLERLALQNTIVDGDVIPLPVQSGSIQLLEAHRMRTPTNTTRNVVHGVLLNDFRRRLEYWITNEDVGLFAPLNMVGQVSRYKAREFDELTGKEERQVLHLYMPDRITQTRGITALVPVVDTAGMGDDLFFAQLVKAQMTACVTILRSIKDAGGGNPVPNPSGQGLEVTEDTRPDGTVRQIVGWQPGMEFFSYPGETLEGFAPNVPNAEFFNHANLILSIVAVNLDLPLAVLMLDPSNTNFSGWRGAMDQARQRFQEIQCWFMRNFHTPIYRWKVRQWAAEDAAIRQAIEKSVRRKKIGTDGVDAFGHEWRAQEWPYIEPTQDAMGDVIQERNLLISPRRRAARRGMDYDDLTTEIVEDRATVIEKAHVKAEELNKRLKLSPPLTWKDVALWPMPEGVTVSVGNEQKAEGQDGKAANGKPKIAAAERMNGHAH
jgi:lambda family phage portal protein